MRVFLLALLLLFLYPWASFAQQEQEEEKPTLPEIAPREVEIRGELIIAFPSLERQPLIGFNPPPRIYQVPPGRKPIIYPYKQEVASLPPLKLRTPPELAPTVAPVRPAYGLLALNAGSYLERSATLEIDYPLSSTLRFLTDARYRGSNGHRPFPNSPDSLFRLARAPYNVFDGYTGLEFSGYQFSGSWSLHTGSHARRIWGALPAQDGRQPNRSIYQLGTELKLHFHPSHTFEATSILKYHTGDTELHIPTTSYTLTDVFQHAVAQLGLRFPGKAHWEGTGHVLTQKRRNEFNASLRTYASSLTLYPRQGIRVGVSLLGFAAQQPDTRSRTLLYLSPSFLFRTHLAGWTLVLSNTPDTEAFDFMNLFRHNPYVHPGATASLAPPLESVLFPWNTRLQLQRQTGYLRIAPEIAYRFAPNWRIWKPAEIPGFFTFEYAPARQYILGGTLIWVTATRQQLTLSIHYQMGEITDVPDSKTIPYMPGLELKGNVYLPFFRNRLIYRGELRILAQRYADAQATEPLKNVGTFSSTVIYHLTDGAGLSFSAEKIALSAPEYWKSYPEARNLLKLGAFLHW